MSRYQRVFVVGHPGAGKAVLSKALADKLGWAVIDADFGLEYIIGRNLKEIIGDEGAKLFHQCETEILAHHLKKDKVIINTDVGIADIEKNRVMLSSEFTVHVRVSPSVQVERLQKHQSPLLPVTDLEAFLVHLHKMRDEHFEQISDFSLSSDDGAIETHVSSIMSAMNF